MSILLVSPLAGAAEGGIPIDVVLAVLSGVAIAAAFFTRLLPPRKLPGPERIPPASSAWPLAAVLFGGAGFYLFAVSAVAALWHALGERGTLATTQPLESDAGIAVLSTVPAVFGFVGLMLGDRTVFDAVRQDLGIRLGLLGRGLSKGFAGGLVLLPPLYLSSQLMEWLYRAVHYEHPTEHPLLRVLGARPNSLVMGTIIFGACMLAPLWEELLFRGHIQTLILRLVQYLVALSRGQGPAAVPVDLPAQPAGPLAYEGPNTSQPAWASWLAIVLTSLLFAAIHPTWSAPVIFLLAVCLGYAYDRTGNLWVPITMHAMFNTTSTLLFLAGAGSH